MKKPAITIRDILWIGLFCLLGAALYLSSSYFSGGLGFPLDDAWIHQTYARNLGEHLQWAYFPGNNTNGSTAPLWTFLLSIGFFLKIPTLIWTYALGVSFLMASAILGCMVLRKQLPLHPKMSLMGALILAGEWHLLWAAVSGMETLLLVFVELALFYLLLEEQPSWGIIGLMCGLAVWIRPDAITLAGPALFILAFTPNSLSQRGSEAIKCLGGLILITIPFVLFNKISSGNWLPNTFYAKQAEYATMLNQPLLIRLGQLLLQPLTGVGALILPGFLYQVGTAINKRNWKDLAWAVWGLGYIGIYALSLPVSYQHGRYQMPVIPVYLILGMGGCIQLICRTRLRRWQSVLVKTWGFSILAVWGIFIFLGASAYRDDTHIIQSEMVKTSQWIALNTPQNTVIAAHDIGALGYFGKRKLIDLAGLVTPQIIPIIRNEPQLDIYLNQNNADYLMTFPDWYATLPQNKKVVYTSADPLVVKTGGQNMAVYLWK